MGEIDIQLSRSLSTFDLMLLKLLLPLAPDDYVALETTLTFNASVRSQEVTVTIQTDTADELDDVLFGRLERVTGARVVVSPDQATVTIVDDDSK